MRITGTRAAPPDDEAIRAALVERLRRQAREGRRTSIIHELGLREGRVRVDVAVVTDRLHGYENKSDRDDGARLGRQVSVYEAVLDRATLVVGGRAARWAVSRVPAWWEVIVARRTAAGRVVLTRSRRGRINREVRTRALIELLWRDETLALLERHGIAHGVRSKPRGTMWNHATTLLDPRTIREAVTATLHERDYRNGWGGTRRVSL